MYNHHSIYSLQIKMSLSAGVLQRLQSRAAQADQIVAQLRAQVQLLKNNAGAY